MKLLLGLFIVLAAAACAHPNQESPASVQMDVNVEQPVYICPPCAHHTDHVGEIYEQPGVCPVCKMRLMEQPNFSRINEVALHPGSGNFVMDGGAAVVGRSITVFYHQPESFSPQSKMLIVVPGTGRNAWDYRDAWQQASEKYGVLILALHYPKDQYDFAAYHMGGVITDFSFKNVSDRGEANRYYVADEDIQFQLNPNRSAWLFADFDRVFNAVVATTGSQQRKYDLFGHSAGGQIAHRLVFFSPDTLADRIVAANSGLYTLPDLQTPPLFGLAGTGISASELFTSFAQNLIIMMGEQDVAGIAGGHLLHSPLADKQGLGRRERGEYFFEIAQMTASALAADFNWSMQVVPNTDHDFQAMSQAAAEYLYAN